MRHQLPSPARRQPRLSARRAGASARHSTVTGRVEQMARVGAVRQDLEAGGEIPHLNTITGKAGKARPARRPEPARTLPLATSSPLCPATGMAGGQWLGGGQDAARARSRTRRWAGVNPNTLSACSSALRSRSRRCSGVSVRTLAVPPSRALNRSSATSVIVSAPSSDWWRYSAGRLPQLRPGP